MASLNYQYCHYKFSHHYLIHIIIISIVITIIVIIMIIFAERGLFEQLSAHGLAFPIAAAAEGRYEGALDLLLSIEHYHYFFITIFIILSILGATHLLAQRHGPHTPAPSLFTR